MVAVSNDPFTNLVLGFIAIAILIYAANKIVEKLLKISHYLGVSEMFIGLTVLSIGTSFAELITTVVASTDVVRGTLDYKIGSGAVLGTNVGSDLIQLTFITGIIALIGVIRAKKDFLKHTFLTMIAAEFFVLIFALDGTVSRLEGFLLFSGYMAYLYSLYRKEKAEPTRKKAESVNLFIEIPLVAIGFGVLLLCAEFILRVSVFFVGYYGVGGSLIGALVIGIATAIPEFTTALSSMKKKAPDFAVGTLIGSNITNPAMVISTGAMISTLAVPRPTVVFDFPFTIIAALIILFYFWRRGKLSKWNAISMILMYLLFVFLRIMLFSVD